MIRLAMFLILGAFTLWAVPPSRVEAQMADPRDSEGAYFAPSNTLLANFYLRHISSQESPQVGSSRTLGLVRGTYLLKFGNFTFTPLDFFIPVVEATAHRLDVVTDPATGAVTQVPSTVHLSGVADPRYLPTLAYHLTQDAASLTHTWISLTTYLQIPIGEYDPTRIYLFNIGENRFSVQPVLTIGQRLFKILTIEGFFGPHIIMDNEEAGTGNPMLPTVTVSQEMGLNGGAHLAVDLSPTFNLGFSYLFASTGVRTATAPNGAVIAPLGQGEGTAHQAVVTMAMNVAPTTTIRLQWAEGLARDGVAVRERYLGLRFSHAMFFGDPPPGAAPPSAPPPPAGAPPAEDPPAAEDDMGGDDMGGDDMGGDDLGGDDEL